MSDATIAWLFAALFLVTSHVGFAVARGYRDIAYRLLDMLENDDESDDPNE